MKIFLYSSAKTSKYCLQIQKFVVYYLLIILKTLGFIPVFQKGGEILEIKKFNVGDTLVMKKNHACGKKSLRFLVLTLGSDIKIRCLQCGREVTVPRVKLEKNIRLVECADKE